MNNITIVINDGNYRKKKDFIRYTIPEGENYTTENPPTRVKTREYAFQVCFDSSAIYTLPAADQHDINKVTGFSDNQSLHQRFSARFGWRWSEDALRLFAYVYNNGERQEQQLSIIEIGQVYTCKISVKTGQYIFHIKELDIEVAMPRAATTKQAMGYRLYPYFGGNNPAPHDVRIWLKYL